MPLVVPGLQSTDGSSGEDWSAKLLGKKLGEQHDEIVSARPPPRGTVLSASRAGGCKRKRLDGLANQCVCVCAQTFAKTDLPKEHRVLKPDSMSTMDFKPERLNIHVDEDGTVKKVNHG